MRKIDYVFIVLICGIIGFVVGQQGDLNKHTRTLGDISECLKMDFDTDRRHDRIHRALVDHINTLYKYLGVTGKIGLVERDTTIDLLWPPLMGSDPIPPPAGLEAIIERSIYQNLKKPRVADTVKWEKTEE